MKKCIVGIIILFSSVFYVASHASAAVIVDLWSAFPNTQGENNFYALAYFTGTSSDVQLTDDGEYRFNYPTGGTYKLPYLYRAAESPWILTHPSNSAHAVLEYVVPHGTYDSYICTVSGEFAMRNVGSIRGYVQVNQNTYEWSGVISGNGSSVSFNEIFTLDPGDRLRFGVDPNGPDTSDGSLLRGTIRLDPVIPEPATMALFGLGSLGFGIFKRKKAKS